MYLHNRLFWFIFTCNIAISIERNVSPHSYRKLFLNSSEFESDDMQDCIDDSQPSNYDLKIYTVPVGAGDGTVIKCPTGEITILDMGSSTGPRFPNGMTPDQFIQFLKDISRTDMDDNDEDNPWNENVKNIFLTHNDKDHINFFNSVIENLEPKPRVFVGGTKADYKLNFEGSSVYSPQGICIEKRGDEYDDDEYDSKHTSCGHFTPNDGDNVEENWHCKRKNGKGDFVKCTWKSGTKLEDENQVFPCSNKEWSLRLMAANYDNRVPPRSPFGRGSNQNSLVLKLTPFQRKSPSMLFMGDFANKHQGETFWSGDHINALITAADTFYKDANTGKYQVELGLGLQSDAFMVPHHGAFTLGTNDKRLHDKIFYRDEKYPKRGFAVVSSDYKTISTKGWRHPHCTTIQNIIGAMNLPKDTITDDDINYVVDPQELPCKKASASVENTNSYVCGEQGNREVQTINCPIKNDDFYGLYQTTKPNLFPELPDLKQFILTTMTYPTDEYGKIRMRPCYHKIN